MKRLAIWFGILLIWILPSSTSRGDLLFEFGVGGVIKSNIEIPGPGLTVPIQVYLSQTGTTTILEDEGLALAGIRVTFDDPTIARVRTSSDIQENSAFFVISKDVKLEPPAEPLWAELNMMSDDIFVPVRPEGTNPNRILLGTFTFTGLALGTTTIRVSDLDPNQDDIITGVGTVLDLISPASATLTVTPEPGSVALSLVALGGAAVVGVYRSRRKRRKTSTEDPPLVAV